MAAAFNTGNLQEPRSATAQDVQTATNNIVNGMGTLMTGYGSGDLTVEVNVGDTKLATALLSPLRAVSRANPEVKDDR